MKWYQLLAVLLCAALITSGQQIYLTQGDGPRITTDNTEILITDIGEDAEGGQPSLTCRTDLTTCCRDIGDNNGTGGMGQWTYPDGSVLLNRADSIAAGQQFYFVRNDTQLIRLGRIETNNPLSPTGSYCCTIPTTGGDMTLCANLVLCPSLSLDNGMVAYNDNTLGLNTVATHTCNPSYILLGTRTRTCETNTGGEGVWSGMDPLCEATDVICPDLRLQKGEVTYSGPNRTVGTTATFTCSSAQFAVNGVESVTCGSDGSWSPDPPLHCAYVCPELLVDNGTVLYEPISGPLFKNTVATYTCNTGYALSGDTIRTCAIDGRWSGSAPTCQIICFDLSIDNGAVVYSNGSPDNRPVGTEATYRCFSGYSLNTVTTRICRSIGRWSESVPVPVCQEVVCSDLTLPNGEVTYTTGSPDNRPIGTVATYSCNDNHILTGGNNRTCEIGGWNRPTNANCQETVCGPPPSIDAGSPGTPSSTVVGGEVMYSCDPGLVHSGSSLITCLSTGQWSTPPTCQSPPPVYLSLSSTNYLSGLPEISVSSVGEGGGLVCRTNLPNCCESEGGNWYHPNGSVVMTEGVLYVRRGDRMISLQLSSGPPLGTGGGLYCCEVPINGGATDTACIILTAPDHGESAVFNHVAIIVGAVAMLLLIIVSVVSGTVIVCLALRYKKAKLSVPQTIPLSDTGQNQNLTVTYDTIPDNIGVRNITNNNYMYTQNEAYQDFEET